MDELKTSVEKLGDEIFAVVHVRNQGNGTSFPEEINNYLSQGYYVKSVDITEQSNGSSAIAFVTLRKQ